LRKVKKTTVIIYHGRPLAAGASLVRNR